ncbi:MAG TPA: DUF4837 family protein [Tenuifilaceae bacterium]|nr:DUF4837 family protein [Tenuifilaceae bacterium]HOZ14047.1 DUF4837 family protein [Tenuifilaceae bacterium]
MKRTLIYIAVIILFGSNVSCKKGSKGETSYLPNVTGGAGEIVLVLPKPLWTDSIGINYKEILTQEFPYIPQSEPTFDLISIPNEVFTDIFKSHRNLIINQTSSEFKEPKFILKRDVWASPQTVLYVVGPSFSSIGKFIKKEKEKIIAIFEQAERDRVIQSAVTYPEVGVVEAVKKKFNATIKIPKGYTIRKQTDDFMWISHETPKISQGLIIYMFPYKEKNTFSAEYLIKKRDEFVSQIPGPTDSSYMTTSMVFPPDFSAMMFKDRYFGILRGFWDVYKHPMGGPFISFSTLDEKRQTIINVEAYVYAPGSKKRNYLRQVEALVYTLEVN